MRNHRMDAGPDGRGAWAVGGAGLSVVLLIAALSGSAASSAPIAAASSTDLPSAMVRQAEQLRDRASNGDNRAFEILDGLTTEIGARPAASDAEHRAADWAVAKMQELGFKNVHRERFTMTAWRRGVETAEVVAPFPQRLIVTALGNSVATPAGGIEADVALFHSYEELLEAPVGSLGGKIAVVTQPMPIGGYPSYFRIRSEGPVEAARRGAVAYLIRSLGTDGRRVPHTGAILYPPTIASGMRIPAGALTAADAEQLERIARRGRPVRLRLTLTPTILPGEMSETVSGEIPGREHPEEVVLIGGHLDSWDLGTGAIDDGAGVATTLAAAKMIADLPDRPARTIRVVLFGAEEVGQSNAAYAAAHQADEQARIVVASECDLGSDHVYAVQLPKGAADAPFGHALARVLGPIGAFVSPDAALEGGGDLDNLVGVPFANLQQDATRYFEFHHTPEDTLDKVDARQLNQNVAAWVAFTYLVANAKVDFRQHVASR